MRPSLLELFLGFSTVAAMGFGGMLPFARRMVLNRAWLSEDEFARMYSLAVFLPGGSVMNAAVLVGHRFHGWRGAIVAFAGIMVVPAVLAGLIATLYVDFGSTPAVQGTLEGIAAAAAGLLLTTGARLSWPLLRTQKLVGIPLAIAVFVTAGILRMPLPAIVITAVPIGLLAERRGPR